MEEKIQEVVKNNPTNKKLRFIILTAIIAIVLIGGVFFVLSKTLWAEKRTTEQIISDSMVKTLLMDASEKEIVIGIDQLEASGEVDPETQMALSLIKDLEMKFIIRQDEKSSQGEILFSLDMRTISLLKGSIYMNDELIGLDFPLLYEKPLTLTWEDLAKQMDSDAETEKEELKTIRKQLLAHDYESIEDFDAVAYEALFRSFIAEILSSEGVEEKVVVAKEKVEADAYTADATMDQLITFINSILSKMDEEKNITDKLNNGLKLELDSELIHQAVDFVMNSKIYIKDDLILKGETTLDGTITGLLPEPILATVTIDYSLESQSDIEFDGLQMDNAINVSAMTEEEKDALMLDIKASLLENISENQILSGFTEYIDIESLLGE